MDMEFLSTIDSGLGEIIKFTGTIGENPEKNLTANVTPHL